MFSYMYDETVVFMFGTYCEQDELLLYDHDVEIYYLFVISIQVKKCLFYLAG